MHNPYVYLSIFLGIKILLLIFLAFVIFKGALRLRNKPAPNQKVFPYENFYCVKNKLKQMNEHFYVAQIIFTNKKNCTLTAQSESPHRFSEGQD
jgi:NADH:ubiquinone oxidoreductase subunit 3 (subunit A)